MPVSRPAIALAALVACAVGGCASLGKPAWLDPGPVRSQQRRAVRFDPFLQTEVRHDQLSTMDGSRPRDYSEPLPEVTRPRWWSQPAR